LCAAPADVVAAWLDAGVESVRSSSSGRDYTASHTFADDWRTHRVWDWLNHCYWRFIPTDRRLLQVQVRTVEKSWCVVNIYMASHAHCLAYAGGTTGAAPVVMGILSSDANDCYSCTCNIYALLQLLLQHISYMHGALLQLQLILSM
jgi:hypothetical protein